MPDNTLRLRFSLTDVGSAAKAFWDWAGDARIITFSGSLGAGKTTFIHAICDVLGVVDAVSSPTFALINEYRFVRAGREHIIHHMDWYRVRDADEAVDAGMEDALNNPAVICFVEWPEKASELLSMPHLRVSISHAGEWERLLEAEWSA